MAYYSLVYTHIACAHTLVLVEQKFDLYSALVAAPIYIYKIEKLIYLSFGTFVGVVIKLLNL